MVKKAQPVLLMFIVLFLSACGKKPIMSALVYNKPVDCHIQKNAFLRWEVGKEHASSLLSHNYNQPAGILGTIVVATVDSMQRSYQPSRYVLNYGKAEQAIFMTSFRDVLQKEAVFKKVELINDFPQKSSNDVLVNIYFKKTRVASPERNFKITLSVDMSITSAGRAPWKRTYVVESDLSAGTSFVDQQTSVSSKLLDTIITAIPVWHKESMKG